MLAAALGPTSVAQAAPPSAAVTIATGSSGVAYGQSVTATGVFTIAGRPAAATVRIVGMPSGEDRWVLLATASAGSNGKWSAALKPLTSYKLKAEVPASSGHAAASSRYVDLPVQAQLYSVTPGSNSYAVANAEKTVTATVYSQLAGQRAKITVLRYGTWTDSTVSRVETDGTITLHYLAKAGDTATRIYLPAARGLVSKLGPVVPLTMVASVEDLGARTKCVGAAGSPAAGVCSNPLLSGLALPTTARATLTADTGGSYAKGCWTANVTVTVPMCSYGSTKKDAYRIALVGDSHAAGYVAGLRDRLGPKNWHMDTYLGITCRWLAQPAGDECAPRSADISKRILAGKYDMVVVSGLRQPRGVTGDQGAAAITQGYQRAWAPVIATGVKLVVIADQPALTDELIACTTDVGAMAASRCTTPRSFGLGGVDPMLAAVASSPGASLLDLTSHYCTADTCPLVIGGVIVFRDRHHISGTWSRTLGPYVLDGLDRIRRGA